MKQINHNISAYNLLFTSFYHILERILNKKQKHTHKYSKYKVIIIKKINVKILNNKKI